MSSHCLHWLFLSRPGKITHVILPFCGLHLTRPRSHSFQVCTQFFYVFSQHKNASCALTHLMCQQSHNQSGVCIGMCILCIPMPIVAVCQLAPTIMSTHHPFRHNNGCITNCGKFQQQEEQQPAAWIQACCHLSPKLLNPAMMKSPVFRIPSPAAVLLQQQQQHPKPPSSCPVRAIWF